MDFLSLTVEYCLRISMLAIQSRSMSLVPSLVKSCLALAVFLREDPGLCISECPIVLPFGLCLPLSGLLFVYG